MLTFLYFFQDRISSVRTKNIKTIQVYFTQICFPLSEILTKLKFGEVWILSSEKLHKLVTMYNYVRLLIIRQMRSTDDPFRRDLRFKKCTWGRVISPCNHMYVLNGKIDECRHSSVAISRANGKGREHGVPTIRRGVVWSNRLGKLTKSRQLSARSWVTDFECSHVAYTRVCKSKSPHLSLSPSRQQRKCLFDERSKEHISPTLSAYPLARFIENPPYFIRTFSHFARFHFRGTQLELHCVYCNTLHPLCYSQCSAFLSPCLSLSLSLSSYSALSSPFSMT